MSDPLKVNLENILPLTYARDHFSQIVSEVQKDKLYILTKGGKPAVAIIDVKYLEDITGGHVQKEAINEEIKKAPEKVGLAPMIEHPSTSSGQAPSPTPPPIPKPEPPKPIEQPKPFDSAPSNILGTSQGKPAGFAAPQPPKSVTPPPPIPKVEPKPMPKPFDSDQGKPTPSTLVMPGEKPFDSAPSTSLPRTYSGQVGTSQGKPAPTAIPNKPLTTLPPVGQNNNQKDIDVQFTPDVEELNKNAQDGKLPDGEKIAPDDENPPAQYAGEKDKEKEPEDMALD